MLLKFLRALWGGLILGPVVALLSVPIALLVAIVSGVLGAAVMLLIGLPLAMIPHGEVLIGLLFLVLSAAASAFVYVQLARYAGSMAGLRPLGDQPRFMNAFWECLVMILIVQIAIGLVAGVIWFAAMGVVGVDGLQDALREDLGDGGQDLLGSVTLWIIGVNFTIGNWLVVLVTIPRACLTERAPAAYDSGLVLARFVVALPIYSIVTAMLGVALIIVVASLPDLAGDEVAAFALTAGMVLIFYLLNGFTMAFEARLLTLLRGRVSAHVLAQADMEYEETDYRAIREEWSRRS